MTLKRLLNGEIPFGTDYDDDWQQPIERDR